MFCFDHEVLNVAGEYDMKILGNGFYSATQKADEPLGGSSEPGIVMVSRDDNGNGLPDDEWYELAGSEETNEKTLFNYSITYYRPNDDTPAETYIRWEAFLYVPILLQFEIIRCLYPFSVILFPLS